MPLLTAETAVKDCLIVLSDIHTDQRGSFSELFRASGAKAIGLPQFFDQQNVSVSKKNTIRGLHGQVNKPQGKLVNCLQGKIWDVCVDARPRSPTYGKWTAVELGVESNTQVGLYIPPGCLHGFAALEDNSVVHYLCTTEYDHASDGGVSCFDPTLNIPWPVNPEHVSAKDARLPSWLDYLNSLRYH